MNSLQLSLTRLIGNKELSFGCIIIDPANQIFVLTNNQSTHYIGVYKSGDEYSDGSISKKVDIEIIGHPATLSDLHRFLGKKGFIFSQDKYKISFEPSRIINDSEEDYTCGTIKYNSSKDLLDQEEETLKQIIELIKSNS